MAPANTKIQPVRGEKKKKKASVNRPVQHGQFLTHLLSKDGSDSARAKLIRQATDEQIDSECVENLLQGNVAKKG